MELHRGNQRKNAIEREKILSEQRSVELQRKEKCIALKTYYISTSEPTTQIALDEVLYNEKFNSCYYWYLTYEKNGLSEAIADLYSSSIVAQTAPECAGKWCMTKEEFDKKKVELGFTSNN